MGSGDGWTTCAAGHRHWGLFGAAGLLLIDADRVILQHRAPWTHEGDTWGIPGGARDSHESALVAAVREAGEEAGLIADDVNPIGLYIDDHIGWAYTTVVARPTRQLRPVAANAESVSVSWQPIDDVSRLPLHRGFAAAWEHLRSVPPALFLVIPVDVPADGDLIETLRLDGIAVHDLPGSIDPGGLSRLLPRLVVTDDPDAAGRDLDGRGQVLVVASLDELVALTGAPNPIP